MTRIKLTNTLVRKALPKDKPYSLSDYVVPGLLLTINPSGKKTFSLRLQNFKKKLGNFPVDDVSAARQKSIQCYADHFEEIKIKNQRKSTIL